MEKSKSNIKRCPYIKVHKKEIVYDSHNRIIGETVTEELNDCYKNYCMAYDITTHTCKIFDIGQINIIEGPEDVE